MVALAHHEGGVLCCRRVEIPVHVVPFGEGRVARIGRRNSSRLGLWAQQHQRAGAESRRLVDLVSLVEGCLAVGIDPDVTGISASVVKPCLGGLYLRHHLERLIDTHVARHHLAGVGVGGRSTGVGSGTVLQHIADRDGMGCVGVGPAGESPGLGLLCEGAAVVARRVIHAIVIGESGTTDAGVGARLGVVDIVGVGIDRHMTLNLVVGDVAVETQDAAAVECVWHYRAVGGIELESASVVGEAHMVVEAAAVDAGGADAVFQVGGIGGLRVLMAQEVVVVGIVAAAVATRVAGGGRLAHMDHDGHGDGAAAGEVVGGDAEEVVGEPRLGHQRTQHQGVALRRGTLGGVRGDVEVADAVGVDGVAVADSVLGDGIGVAGGADNLVVVPMVGIGEEATADMEEEGVGDDLAGGVGVPVEGDAVTELVVVAHHVAGAGIVEQFLLCHSLAEGGAALQVDSVGIHIVVVEGIDAVGVGGEVGAVVLVGGEIAAHGEREVAAGLREVVGVVEEDVVAVYIFGDGSLNGAHQDGYGDGVARHVVVEAVAAAAGGVRVAGEPLADADAAALANHASELDAVALAVGADIEDFRRPRCCQAFRRRHLRRSHRVGRACQVDVAEREGGCQRAAGGGVEPVDRMLRPFDAENGIGAESGDGTGGNVLIHHT